MDNKKMYKRISTCFWFLLAIMPVITSLIQSCFILFNSFESITLSELSSFGPGNMEDLGFFPIFQFQLENGYKMITPNFLKSMFSNLFNIIDSNMWNDILSYFCSWFCWVYFIELMVDFIVWLPKFFHSLLEKGVGKID